MSKKSNRKKKTGYFLKRMGDAAAWIPESDIKKLSGNKVRSMIAIRYLLIKGQMVYIDGGKKELTPHDMVAMCLDFALEYGPKNIRKGWLDEEIVVAAYQFLIKNGFHPGTENVGRLIQGASLEAFMGDAANG